MNDKIKYVPNLPLVLQEHEYALNSLNLRDILRRDLKEFVENEYFYTGYVEGGVEKCNSFLKCLKHLGYSFCIRNSTTSRRIKSNKELPRLIYSSSRNKINIKMFGPPFFITKYWSMVCIRGPPRNLKNTTSKKMGCLAELRIKLIRYFPKYAVRNSGNQQKKHQVITQLKMDMKNPTLLIEFCERVYISLSKETFHNHKPFHVTLNAIKTNNKQIEKDSFLQPFSADNSDNMDNIEKRRLIQKQKELKKMANNVAIISELITEENLLDSSIRQLKKIVEIFQKHCVEGVDVE